LNHCNRFSKTAKSWVWPVGSERRINLTLFFKKKKKRKKINKNKKKRNKINTNQNN